MIRFAPMFMLAVLVGWFGSLDTVIGFIGGVAACAIAVIPLPNRDQRS